MESEWVIDPTEHTGLVKMCAAKFAKQYQAINDYDDLESIALETLYKCCKRFKPELGWKFSTYAYRAMYNNMRRWYVREHVYVSARARPVPVDPYIIASANAGKSAPHKESRWDEVQELLDKVPCPTTQQILILRARGCSFRHIARSLGISRNAAQGRVQHLQEMRREGRL